MSTLGFFVVTAAIFGAMETQTWWKNVTFDSSLGFNLEKRNQLFYHLISRFTLESCGCQSLNTQLKFSLIV